MIQRDFGSMGLTDVGLLPLQTNAGGLRQSRYGSERGGDESLHVDGDFRTGAVRLIVLLVVDVCT